MGGVNILLFVTLFGFTRCQFQSTSYSCALPSLCRDGGTNIIDPRILTPGTVGVVGPTGGGFPGGGSSGFPGGNTGTGTGFPGSGTGFPGGSTGTGTGFPGSSAIGPPGIPGGTGGGAGGFPGTGTGGTPTVNIVSPTSCPAGYIRCTNVICGTPSIQPSQTDGFATQGSFPWQAFIRNNNNLSNRNGYAGGGVLLDQYHVLTAAHKVTNLTSISVLIGVYNTGNLANVQSSQVSQVWIHSNYNQTYLKNDVAILQLATPIYINTNAMPICLPQSGQSYVGLPTSSCLVSGWGQSSFSSDDAPTQSLKQVHVPIVTNTQCTASYNSILGAVNTAAYLDFPYEICAGGQSQLDACTQDGGSPLVCSGTSTTQFSLVGLVLWGKNCGQAGRYGVYLNVPSYTYWIQCVIQCLQGAQSCSNCPARRFL